MHYITLHNSTPTTLTTPLHSTHTSHTTPHHTTPHHTTPHHTTPQALLRPGRLGQCIHIPLPDPPTRLLLLSQLLSSLPTGSDVNLTDLVARTTLFSGAEVWEGEGGEKGRRRKGEGEGGRREGGRREGGKEEKFQVE